MSWRLVVIAVVCVAGQAVRADEAPPRPVEFHTAAYAFPCRDKTPQEFATVNPDRKVVEASIRVSASFNLPEESVDRVEYRLRMPVSFEVTDYLPKTTVGSEVAGQIGVGRQDSSRSMTVVSLDAGARAGFRLPGGVEAGTQVNAQGKADRATEVGSSVQMSLLPPKQLITSASTQEGGRTLHFKLKRYNQITLEGDKDFAFLAAVPRDWKGDCFTLECTAFLKDVPAPATRHTLMIGLYASGDLAAKKRVESAAREFRPPAPSTPHVAAPSPSPAPAAAAADPDLAKYAGKYACKYTFGLMLHLNLRPDGTFSGTGKAIYTGAASEQRGVWSARDDVLVITLKHEKSILYDSDFNMELIHSKIKSFDEKRRVLRTESDYELTGE